MKAMLIFFLLVAILAQDAMQESIPWSYSGANGPDKWCDIGYATCCGSNQSPINVITKHTKRLHEDLVFESYKVPPTVMELQNNGHSAEITFATQAKNIPRISGGPFKKDDEYYLDNIHFHWGSISLFGSEHTINGRRHPMEMHMVHYNSKYNSSQEASKHADGLTVVSVLFHAIILKNEKYNQFVNYFPLIKYKEDIIRIPTFPISDLLPSDKDTFYTYKGSLTTPPCSESVTWLISTETIPISFHQLNKFRSLHFNEEDAKFNPSMENNFRPTQNLNDREVHLVKDE